MPAQTPYRLLFRYSDRERVEWVCRILDEWFRSSFPGAVDEYIAIVYTVVVTRHSTDRDYAIHFDSEADATAFILKLS